VVKFEGGGVVAELSSIKTRDPNAPVQFQGPAFSVSAPAGWMFYDSQTRKTKTKSALAILDPNAQADSFLVQRSLDSLEPENKKSVRALADFMVDANKNALGLTVRTNGWQDRTIAGLPALSFICDYTEGQDEKVFYGICSLAPTNTVDFSAQISAKDFEAYRPKFDAIVDSYKNN
jgi:hypothetical protein